jgi:hypothetical protein
MYKQNIPSVHWSRVLVLLAEYGFLYGALTPLDLVVVTYFLDACSGLSGM